MTGETGPGRPAGWPPPVAYAPDHPQATTSLVLGVAGVVLCGLAAPFAWATGRRTVREIDASQGRLGGRGAAQAGYVLGIIGTMILGAAVLLLVAWLAFFVFLAGLAGLSVA
jgi:hypothetical protein